MGHPAIQRALRASRVAELAQEAGAHANQLRLADAAKETAQSASFSPKPLWLPAYDKRVPGNLMFHGSNNSSISGPFTPGLRDSGWFGRGMYTTMYPEYAARWGSHLHAAPLPDVPFANVWTDSAYKQMHFDAPSDKAHKAAGGHEAWFDNEDAYSRAFRDSLLHDGIGGVRVGIGDHPDAEIVIFDPDAAGVKLSPFASRFPGSGAK